MRHVLSLGAGVQSSTLALMAAAGEVTPMPDAAIFADTQAEPAGVYRWLDWLEKHRSISWCWDDTAGENPKALWHVYDFGINTDFATAREAIDTVIRSQRK